MRLSWGSAACLQPVCSVHCTLSCTEVLQQHTLNVKSLSIKEVYHFAYSKALQTLRSSMKQEVKCKVSIMCCSVVHTVSTQRQTNIESCTETREFVWFALTSCYQMSLLPPGRHLRTAFYSWLSLTPLVLSGAADYYLHGWYHYTMIVPAGRNHPAKQPYIPDCWWAAGGNCTPEGCVQRPAWTRGGHSWTGGGKEDRGTERDIKVGLSEVHMAKALFTSTMTNMIYLDFIYLFSIILFYFNDDWCAALLLRMCTETSWLQSMLNYSQLYISDHRTAKKMFRPLAILVVIVFILHLFSCSISCVHLLN